MKILALERELSEAADAEGKSLLKSEAARVWELYQAGVVREIYFDQEHHTAVLILECSDADDARKILETLPLVQAGMIAFDIIPLVPYSGFARLFPTE